MKECGLLTPEEGTCDDEPEPDAACIQECFLAASSEELRDTATHICVLDCLPRPQGAPSSPPEVD